MFNKIGFIISSYGTHMLRFCMITKTSLKTDKNKITSTNLVVYTQKEISAPLLDCVRLSVENMSLSVKFSTQCHISDT